MDKAECGTQPETPEKVIYAKYLAACHGRIHQEKESSKEILIWGVSQCHMLQDNEVFANVL
jgi:hypothetical protein